MKISLCNEVIRGLDFAAQCDLAAALGYDGLELAPFTLGENPHLFGERRCNALRRAASDAGVEITGLHWLLVTPEGLSITSGDSKTRKMTLEVMRRLIDLCAALGGQVLVHGSPQQRLVGNDPDAAERGRDAFAAIAEDAEKANVVYCIEPLSHEETDFITSVAEAADVVRTVNSPALKTMIDCRAAALTEALPLPQLIEHWLPTDLISHVHLNDVNKRAPGQGEIAFGPVLHSLKKLGYSGVVGIEPFIYKTDGRTVAARAIGYIHGLLESLAG